MAFSDERMASEQTLGNDDGVDDAIVLHMEDSTAIVPDVTVLLHGTYARIGSDLHITAPDGTVYLVEDFFIGGQPQADIAAPGGQVLAAAVVARLAGPPEGGVQVVQDLAQMSDAVTGVPAIGTVTKVTGDAFATRPDGTKVLLKSGDPVFQGDVIETAADGAVGITFIDDSEFALGGTGRMVLDELIFDPDDGAGKSSFSLVSGVFSFVSGQIAKGGPDAMTLDTPTGTIGIRGTKGIIRIETTDLDGDGEPDVRLEVALLDTGEIVVTSSQGVTQVINQIMTGFRIETASGLSDFAPRPGALGRDGPGSTGQGTPEGTPSAQGAPGPSAGSPGATGEAVVTFVVDAAFLESDPAILSAVQAMSSGAGISSMRDFVEAVLASAPPEVRDAVFAGQSSPGTPSGGPSTVNNPSGGTAGGSTGEGGQGADAPSQEGSPETGLSIPQMTQDPIAQVLSGPAVVSPNPTFVKPAISTTGPMTGLQPSPPAVPVGSPSSVTNPTPVINPPPAANVTIDEPLLDPAPANPPAEPSSDGPVTSGPGGADSSTDTATGGTTETPPAADTSTGTSGGTGGSTGTPPAGDTGSSGDTSTGGTSGGTGGTSGGTGGTSGGTGGTSGGTPPTGQTITMTTTVYDGSSSSTNDTITGTPGNDTITAGAGADSIDALGGDDVITGGAGADHFFGGDGSDRFVATLGDGDDTLDGGLAMTGGGIMGDRVDYSVASAKVTVDLMGGTAYGTEIGNDVLLDIEHVTTGSGNDLVILPASTAMVANLVSTGSGADIVRYIGSTAFIGTDTITFSGGDDTLDLAGLDQVKPLEFIQKTDGTVIL